MLEISSQQQQQKFECTFRAKRRHKMIFSINSNLWARFVTIRWKVKFTPRILVSCQILEN